MDNSAPIGLPLKYFPKKSMRREYALFELQKRLDTWRNNINKCADPVYAGYINLYDPAIREMRFNPYASHVTLLGSYSVRYIEKTALGPSVLLFGEFHSTRSKYSPSNKPDVLVANYIMDMLRYFTDVSFEVYIESTFNMLAPRGRRARSPINWSSAQLYMLYTHLRDPAFGKSMNSVAHNADIRGTFPFMCIAYDLLMYSNYGSDSPTKDGSRSATDMMNYYVKQMHDVSGTPGTDMLDIGRCEAGLAAIRPKLESLKMLPASMLRTLAEHVGSADAIGAVYENIREILMLLKVLDCIARYADRAGDRHRTRYIYGSQWALLLFQAGLIEKENISNSALMRHIFHQISIRQPLKEIITIIFKHIYINIVSERLIILMELYMLARMAKRTNRPDVLVCYTGGAHTNILARLMTGEQFTRAPYPEHETGYAQTVHFDQRALMSALDAISRKNMRARAAPMLSM